MGGNALRNEAELDRRTCEVPRQDSKLLIRFLGNGVWTQRAGKCVA